jgi:glycosyltransferase involved in cell wall biosynthesis
VSRNAYDFRGKLLILRLNRLGHVPPAFYATKILLEGHLPVLVFEFSRRKSGRLFSFHEREGITVIRFSPSLKFLPKKFIALATFLLAALWLSQKLYRQRPRLILAHGIQEQTLAWILNRILGISYVVHVHEIYVAQQTGFSNKLFLFFEKSALSRAVFLIFPEIHRATFYRRWYDLKNKIFICFNCPPRRAALPPKNSAALLSKLGVSREKKILLYVGGIGHMSCLEFALAAVHECPELVFVAFGWAEPLYLAALKKKAAAYGISERVFFPGEINEQKWEWLENSDLAYCAYSPDEPRLQHVATASNKLMEAIAAGLPVITSDQPDFLAVVEAQGLGVCAPLTASGMARAIGELLAAVDRRTDISQTQRALHLSAYHFEFQFRHALHAFRQFFEVPN